MNILTNIKSYLDQNQIFGYCNKSFNYFLEIVNVIKLFYQDNQKYQDYILISVAILVFLIYLKLTQIRVNKTDKFRKQYYLYQQYQGPYSKIHTELESFKDNPFVFSKFMTILYDNSSKVKDTNDCRAVVGILVNEGENFKIQQYCQQNSCKQQFLPETNSIHSQYNFNVLQRFFIKTFLAYFSYKLKYFSDFRKQYDIFRGETYCVAKAFQTDYSGKLKQIDVYGIYGENAKDFKLSIFEKPELKTD